ncbi:peroxiredoxin family protein [Bacteroides sp. AM10-21B]|uniref:peroxiredoxin family protein n=1 Tax=Bacteroides sp. AM10-21B TaxID=2292001 RepID=UPI001F28A1D6|nr:hypothetical protein [Bacteroides sp. AM10-21B]
MKDKVNIQPKSKPEGTEAICQLLQAAREQTAKQLPALELIVQTTEAKAKAESLAAEKAKEFQVFQEENNRLRNEIKVLQEYKEKTQRELCRVRDKQKTIGENKSKYTTINFKIKVNMNTKNLFGMLLPRASTKEQMLKQARKTVCNNFSSIFYTINKQIFTIAILLFILLTSFTAEQDKRITEANYLKEDSLLWYGYEENANAIYRLMKEHPEKNDSLENILSLLYSKAAIENVGLALKYFTVPSGLQRVYMLRNMIGKKTLKNILNVLPDTLQNTSYANYIRNYIETPQLSEGDQYVKFETQTASGEKFDWRSMENKNLLLLYDGLSCMGKYGRDYLKELLDKTDRKDLDIVVFCCTSNLEHLKELQKHYPDFTLISDFQPEGNSMNIIYDAQSRPTCFIIDRKGIIQVRCEGLDPKLIEDYLKSDRCLK